MSFFFFFFLLSRPFLWKTYGSWQFRGGGVRKRGWESGGRRETFFLLLPGLGFLSFYAEIN